MLFFIELIESHFLSSAFPHPLSLSFPLPFSLLWRRFQPILDDGGLGLALAVDLDPGVTFLSYKNWENCGKVL